MPKFIKKHDLILLFMKLYNSGTCGYFFTKITVIQKLFPHVLQSFIDFNSWFFKLQIFLFVGNLIFILLFFEKLAKLHALINNFCYNFATEIHPINDLYWSNVEVVLTIFLINNPLEFFFDTFQYSLTKLLHRKRTFRLKIGKIGKGLTRNMFINEHLQYLLAVLLRMINLPFINLFQKLK